MSEVMRTSTRVTVLVAWAVVLLASAPPQVVGRELLVRPVAADQRAALALSVIGVGLLAALVWHPVRALHPLLVVLGVLVGAQWAVYTRFEQLGSYPRWLADPSFTVFTLAFGIGHFYGVPYGLFGVLLAGFLGWILARSMVETRGMFWAWLVHFWQDVLIFSFLAVGAITAGG